MQSNIAVIMSVYKNDTLEYLQQSLESLYEQSYQFFDIFLQCDGILSSDLENYLDKEHASKNVYFLNKRLENKGLAYSLNELLSLIDMQYYSYIVRMDADDICINDRIKLQYQFMEANPSVDVCGGFIEEFNMDTNEKQIVTYPETNFAILNGMKTRNSVAHVTTFIRSGFFLKAGTYDPTKLNEDLDLWIRGLEKKCLFYNIQNVLVKVRTNNHFFNRRKNFKRAVEVMQLKLKATKLFSFGIGGYIFAIAHFFLFMSPGNIKQFIYKHIRK